MAKEKQKQQQKPQAKEEIQIPAAYSDAILRHMEHNAKRWETGQKGQTPREDCQPNPRMAETIREQIKSRREKQHEFMRENGMEVPEETKPEPKAKPTQKKRKNVSTKAT